MDPRGAVGASGVHTRPGHSGRGYGHCGSLTKILSRQSRSKQWSVISAKYRQPEQTCRKLCGLDCLVFCPPNVNRANSFIFTLFTLCASSQCSALSWLIIMFTSWWVTDPILAFFQSRTSHIFPLRIENSFVRGFEAGVGELLMGVYEGVVKKIRLHRLMKQLKDRSTELFAKACQLSTYKQPLHGYHERNCAWTTTAWMKGNFHRLNAPAV